MVTDGKVKELRRLLASGKSLAASSRMTEMDEKTARHYRNDNRLPSQRKKPRDYRTRIDPFADVWNEVQIRLEAEPRLQAKTLFQWLQDRYPGVYPDSTRRTFERRVRLWRSTEGPDKAVIFPQVHHPARVAASDFTVMNTLNVTIAGVSFEHMLFHCVLTYSNVESVSLCFSESFEALSEGIQNAFWEFGGVPERHRTDSLSAAINNHSSKKELTARYGALMDHYGTKSERINVRCANENGDVESSNGHLKNRVDQALLLRGSRDFASREDYMHFVRSLIVRANDARLNRFEIERSHLRPLPDSKLDTDDNQQGIIVGSSSTINVKKNIYSVPSRLIGQKVDVRIGAEWIDVTHHGIHVQRMPRLTGVGGSAINYRHVIDSLVRKPGAFENYKYRQDMFPTSHFRIAYDMLCDAHSEKVAVRKYLEILQLAARESQDAVQNALRLQIQSGQSIDVDQVRLMVSEAIEIKPVTDIDVKAPNLKDYDELFDTFDKESPNDESINHTKAPIEKDRIVDTAASQDPAHEDEQRTDRGAAEGAVSQLASADVSRPVSSDGRPSSRGGSQPCSILIGTGGTGMPGPQRESDQASNDQLTSSAGQDMGDVQLRSLAIVSDTTTGESSGGIVLGSSGERTDFRSARCGEESRALCLGESTRPARPEHASDNVQLAGATVADRKAGSSPAEVHQATVSFRGPDDRRPGLRAAESRRDGGAVHAAGGTLRERECSVDEQLGVQQVGPDLQRCDDDGGGDRSLGSPQRDHRVERAKLSRGNSQENEVSWTVSKGLSIKIGFVIGNTSCR
nr:IS21 family transposase [Stieleria neptunia]